VKNGSRVLGRMDRVDRMLRRTVAKVGPRRAIGVLSTILGDDCASYIFTKIASEGQDPTNACFASALACTLIVRLDRAARNIVPRVSLSLVDSEFP